MFIAWWLKKGNLGIRNYKIIKKQFKFIKTFMKHTIKMYFKNLEIRWKNSSFFYVFPCLNMMFYSNTDIFHVTTWFLQQNRHFSCVKMMFYSKTDIFYVKSWCFTLKRTFSMSQHDVFTLIRTFSMFLHDVFTLNGHFPCLNMMFLH